MEGKTARIGDWFPEESLIWQAQDASVFQARNSNGRISPGDGVTLGDAVFYKVPYEDDL
jgi:hypothetical protein